MMPPEPVYEPFAEIERTRRLYRRVAPLYDAFRVLWTRLTRRSEAAMDRLFVERIGPTSRVLELAPGTGINVERLFRQAPRFASYLGVDSSEAMLARARRKARHDPRIDLVIGDANDLEPVAGTFDFIVCTWLLSHLDEPDEAVRGALSKLSPEGTAAFLFLTTPRLPIVRYILERLEAPLHYRAVDISAFEAFPSLERIEVFSSGMATLAVFRAPPARG